MAKEKKRKGKTSKESRTKREWGFSDLVNGATNAAICLGVLSIPCFIFGFSGLGFVLLCVGGIILLLILAAILFGMVVMAKILKHIPHR